MKALRGKRVLVTRSRHQAGVLCDALAARGAQAVLFPTIAIVPVDPSAGLDDALRKLSDCEWVVFTSANGVTAFLDRRDHLGGGPWPDHVQVAAVGPTTRAALAARRIRVRVVPEEFRGDALPAAMGDLTGRRVLLPRADIGRKDLMRALQAGGARVHELPVYRTVPAQPTPAALASLRRGVDAVTFTSPSTVRNFLALLQEGGRRILADAIVATIGPVTTDAARAAGVRVDVQPDEYTIEAMVDALAQFAAVPK